MARRLKAAPTGLRDDRVKEPVNPSVRGTGKQSRRDEKGTALKHAPLHGEGSGHPAGYGRGGKASRG
ncbi:MAG: hypothetical protein HYY04_12815 [Chloroflexi bacterium]|nr:hypothetical protein [Chloroflexota bacterium]